MAIRVRLPIDPILAESASAEFVLTIERLSDGTVWDGKQFSPPTATNAAPIATSFIPPWPNVINATIPDSITGTWVNSNYMIYAHHTLSGGGIGSVLPGCVWLVPLSKGDDNSLGQVFTLQGTLVPS